MKLSEAIKKGSTKRGQAFGTLLKMGVKGSGPTTCALGAAYEAMFHKLPRFVADESDGPYKKLELQFPELLKVGVLDDVPEAAKGVSLEAQIVRLNDDKKFSRETIAELLGARGY